MGASRTRARPFSSLRSSGIGRYRAAACRRESGERRGNLELSHHWRSNTVHDGAPFRSCSRTVASRAGAKSTAGRQPFTCRSTAANQTGTAESLGFALENVGPKDRISNSEEEVVLPHLRFTRDKRGYENTFVVHTHGSGGRRRGKPRSRILYWFRTPPGVRIGRSALDEDAIRLIEQHNPDVDFDWTRILKGQDGTQGTTRGTGGQTPPSGEPRGSAQSDQRRRRIPESQPHSVPEEAAAPEIEPLAETVEVREPVTSIDESPPVEQAEERVDVIEPADVAVVEEFLVEPRVAPPPQRPQAGDALSAVEARLGSEGLSRLRARYSEVLARISETVTDATRQEELKTTAERLNPDTWVTEAEVRAGLEDYESVFESLRSVVGRRRRRGRRSPDRRRDRGSEGPPTDSSVNQSDDQGLDEPSPPDEQ